MKLLRFSKPLELRAVGVNLLAVVGAFGIALVPPAAVALGVGELRLSGGFAALAVVCGPLLLVRRRSAPAELDVRETTLVTALAFPLCAGIASVPFLLGEARTVDALFEAISGLTTTGLGVLQVEPLPTSLLFFRSYCQWLGGAGVLVLSVMIVLPSTRAAIELYGEELFGERGGRERPLASRGRVARAVLGVYGALTLLAFATFFLLGVPALEAATVALSTISTGGFSMFAESIGAYPSTAVRIAVTVFMVLGATSFPLLLGIRRRGVGKVLRDPQLVTLLVLVGSAALLIQLSRFDSGGGLGAVFGAVSAVTTTGFDLGSAAAPIAGLVPIALMIVGGAAGSTAGGIKLWRLVLLARCCVYLVRRALLPKEAVIPVRYGELDIEQRELVSVLGFVTLYGFSLLAGALVLTLCGFSTEDSLFESASALGTVGLSSGVTSADLPLAAKLSLMLQMWAGRVEILPVLLVFTPSTWKVTSPKQPKEERS